MVDESGFDLAEIPRHGWSPVGEPCFMPAPVRGKRFSLLGALFLERDPELLVVEGTVNGDSFKDWVELALVPRLKAGDIVVLDNLSVHKVEGVAALVEATGARLLYLPPYSPDYSPIEPYWSELKRLVRYDMPRTPAELIDTIGAAMKAITPKQIQAWFHHCGWQVGLGQVA